MEYITNTFRSVLNLTKKEIKGHIVSEDKENHRILLMVQKADNYWAIQWYNTNEYNVTSIAQPISSICNTDEMV